MAYYAENPFLSALSRDVVEEAKFIGREHNIRRIEDVIVLPEHQRGSMAIIGLPDVGKHCLVNKVVLSRKAELHKRKLVPIEMDLMTYTGPDKHDKFFRDLISLCKYELESEDLESLTSKITDMSQMTRDALLEWDEAKTISPLKTFFGRIARTGTRVIFILNNFDHADSLFKEHIARIQWLRDLAGSECQVTWVALSCKPIREIKRLPKSISDDFFNVHNLGMFTEEDIEIYFHLLANAGVSLTKERKEAIIRYCGRHPYLLALFGYHLVERFADQPESIDVDEVYRKIEERFDQSYARIIDLVLVNDSDDEKLQKLFQVLFGSSSDIAQKDIDRMLAYGLIEQESMKPSYIAFSEHFQNYLRDKLSDGDFMPVKEKLEKAFSATDPFSWSQTLLPGNGLWNDRYTILEQIGTSGHSQVVKALDTKLGRFVAIKLLYLDPSHNEERITHFQQWLREEAKILSNIEYENIGQVYDVEEDPPGIVMKWIDGKSLDKLWEKRIGLSPMKVTKIGIKLARVLGHVHSKGIIHRDIKPQNIILRENDEPILIDFDIARSTVRNKSILLYAEGTSPFVGTPGYSAPEQIHNPYSVSAPADIYALGVVLYEALTGGYKASYGDVPQHPHIPPSLYQVLCTMLCEDPHGRPDAHQLYVELELCLQELGK